MAVLQVTRGGAEPRGVSTTSALLIPFALAGLAAVGVLAARRSAWRGAAEHSRPFWLAWIVGFSILGFAGPAAFGLGWLPTVWFVFWTAIGTLQPSMIADIVEVHRFGRRQLAAARRPAVTQTTGLTDITHVTPATEVTPVTTVTEVTEVADVTDAAGVSGPPPIRWRPPASASVPVGLTARG